MKQNTKIHWETSKEYYARNPETGSDAHNRPSQPTVTGYSPRVGDKVSFLHYGAPKTGTIAKVGKSLVFLTDGRWLFRQSVSLAVNAQQADTLSPSTKNKP